MIRNESPLDDLPRGLGEPDRGKELKKKKGGGEKRSPGKGKKGLKESQKARAKREGEKRLQN